MSKRKKPTSEDDESSDDSKEASKEEKKTPQAGAGAGATVDSGNDEGSADDSEESSGGEDDSDEKEKKKVVKKKAPPKKRKAASKKKKDPNAPKKPTTAYMFYSKHQRTILQKKHEGIKFGELSKKISVAWKELTEDEKKPYVEQHEKDKLRYNEDMESYKPPEESSSASESDDSSDEGGKKKKKSKAPPKKKQKKEKDPFAPKPKTNAYMYFQKDKREEIKRDNPSLKGVPEIAKKIGAIWRSMDDNAKKPYTDMAEKDKERFDRETETYKKKKAT